MILLTIEEIQDELNSQFLPLEPMLTGLRLVARSGQAADLDKCQRRLQLVFPSSFTELVANYDFGHLTIGPVSFGWDGEYFEWLYRMNGGDLLPESAWWGCGVRPASMVLVANSDQYAILLNIETGAVLARRHGEAEASLVAADFCLFVRALGTVFVERKPSGGNELLAREAARCVVAEDEAFFWAWVAA